MIYRICTRTGGSGLSNDADIRQCSTWYTAVSSVPTKACEGFYAEADQSTQCCARSVYPYSQMLSTNVTWRFSNASVSQESPCYNVHTYEEQRCVCIMNAAIVFFLCGCRKVCQSKAQKYYPCLHSFTSVFFVDGL